MTALAREMLRQRADYTHKFNLRTGRHGWLRLTPAYSVKIVEELIGSVDPGLHVLDPFCGTATTGLSAAYHGHAATTTDINPFLVWLGRAKTDYYSPATIAASRHACTRALTLVKREAVDPAPVPPIHNIERWWPGNALAFLSLLRSAIEAVTETGTKERNLLQVSFCRSLIRLSNAAFNHQSMSFRDDGQTALDFDIDMAALFRKDVNFVIAGAAGNPTGACNVILADSRDLPKHINTKFDLVITSPPYANRMSYIRELRPYMYWLGYLVNGRDAADLDWGSIGGTWGVATSRLMEWTPTGGGYKSRELTNALHGIARDENANGRLLSNYVAKYFEDMWAHLTQLRDVLAPGSRVHYIIGNSTFYGVLLPTEIVYADMLRKLDFTGINIRPVRKRNSKKELIEFDVSASFED
ncbi:MAG: hypothetical protein ACREFK_01150 [Stellaceae bacterium]